MGILAIYRSIRFSVDSSQYYYNRLTLDQKKVYKAMVLGIMAFARKIKMPIRPANEISMIFMYILLDNPLIFYVDSYSYMIDLYKKKLVIKPDYKYNRTTAMEKTNIVRKCLKAFDVVKDKSDFDKELFIHDYCLSNFKYNCSSSGNQYSILGPVIDNAAVCEGFAKFVKLTLDYLGLRSIVVEGKAKKPLEDDDVIISHSWNIVEVAGETYHLDVSFDINMKDQINRYDYFNLCDTAIKQDHVIISDAPTCKTSGKDYYSVNSMTVNSPAECERIIERCFQQGERVIVVKLNKTVFSQHIQDKIIRIAQRQYGGVIKHGATKHSATKRGDRVEVSCNTSQMVFQINVK